MMSLTALIFVVAYRLSQLSEEYVLPSPSMDSTGGSAGPGKTQGVLDDRAFYFV